MLSNLVKRQAVLRFSEVLKQTGWSELTVDLHHFRDRHGAEINLVVSDRRTGELAGVEVKLSATPTQCHARTLATFAERLGQRFGWRLS